MTWNYLCSNLNHFTQLKVKLKKSYLADDVKKFWNVTSNQQRWQIYLMTSGVGKSPIGLDNMGKHELKCEQFMP